MTQPAIHPVDQVLPAPRLLVLGLQHLFIMYAGAVAVPLIVGPAVGLGSSDIAILVSADLLVSGIASVIQSVSISGIFGVRLPVVAGATFTVLNPMIIIADQYGGRAGLTVSLSFGLIPAVASNFYEKFPRDFQIIFGSAITSTVIVVFLLNLLFNHWTAFSDPHPGVLTEAVDAGAVAPEGEPADLESAEPEADAATWDTAPPRTEPASEHPDRLGPCQSCSGCISAMPRRSWPSSWQTAPTSPPSSPTAAMSSSASSPGSTAPCWLSRRPGPAFTTSWSPWTAQSWAGSTCTTSRTAAERGYRVAQHVAGCGLATATVRELGGLAAARPGLRTLRAATSHENAASQKVLIKAGFVPVGPADPAHLGGKQGTWYQRGLAGGPVGDSTRPGPGKCFSAQAPATQHKHLRPAEEA